MNPFEQSQGTNLFSIIINILFGLVAGLMFFLGVSEVLAYGTKLAAELMKATGYGSPMAGFGIATAAPYIVIAPIAGLAVKELTNVRSIKSFLYFAAAVLVGLAIAYFGQGYFLHLMQTAK